MPGVRYRSRVRLALLAGMILGLIGGACLLFLQLGALLEAPASAPRSADLIVSLGGDSGSRVLKASDMYRAGLAPRILLTGLEAAPPRSQRAYLDWREMLLVEEGIPRASIISDVHSANSWEEAVNTRKRMEQAGWKTVLVVSDPPHMRRLEWTWSRAFRGSGLAYLLVAAPSAWWRADGWWRDETSAKFAAQEAVKLVYYIVAR